MPSDNIPGVFRSRPTVTYEDEDGRLIKPCLCKGTQKYVHEGCLNAWRLQNPMEKRNYWQCPTCKYNYRLERMAWGRWISSTGAYCNVTLRFLHAFRTDNAAASQVALTLAIFTLATFFLGFFADPILNLYIDPYGTIADLPTHGTEALYEEEPVSWIEHFIKGMASLGLLGFGKFLLTLSPWQWFNVRGSGVMGGGGRRAANNGRDRLRQVSWVAVVVGIVTVLVVRVISSTIAHFQHADPAKALWKGVRAWSRKTLENWSEKVMDVPGGDDDEDE